VTAAARSFSAQQRAELRDAIARSQLEAREESRRLAAGKPLPPKVVVEAAPRRARVSHLVLVPTFPPPRRVDSEEVRLVRDDLTVAEQARFDRLMAAVDFDSTIDAVTHIALIARRKPSYA
jgi:hypothetical protein